MNIKNVELTKEQERELRQFLPIKPRDAFDYVPKAFRSLPETARPVFHLHSLPGDRSVELSDDMSVRDGNATTYGKYATSVCREGLDGWDNYFDVPYEGNISPLSPALIYELSNTILSRGRLAKEEELGLE